jgi:tetratricopeptide (TPR) repeat protein
MGPELVRHLNELDSPTLGARIKAARLAAGLTQPALAGEDASIAYVSRIERGERRPGPALLEVFAARMGVSADQLVLGYAGINQSEAELELDYGELALAAGESSLALEKARHVLNDLSPVGKALGRAQYIEAASLDSMGDAGAADAFEGILAGNADASTTLKAATALSRVYREQGDLDRAVECAERALARMGEDHLAGGEDRVRLSVTLAAALYENGHVDRAMAVCQSAIGDAEQLASPTARASAYWNASVIEAEGGEVGRALELARKALVLLEAADGVRDLARLRTQLSTILLRVEPPLLDDAKHQLALADRELDWSPASAADKTRNELVTARALYIGGDAAEARRRLTSALESAEGRFPLVQVSGLILLGQIAWSEAAREDARSHYQRAIQVLTGIGSDREAGQLWFELGSLLEEVDLVDEARDAYKRAAASVGLSVRSPLRSVVPAGGR